MENVNKNNIFKMLITLCNAIVTRGPSILIISGQVFRGIGWSGTLELLPADLQSSFRPQ